MMRPTWGMLICGVVLGGALGAAAMHTLRPPLEPPPVAGEGEPRGPDGAAHSSRAHPAPAEEKPDSGTSNRTTGPQNSATQDTPEMQATGVQELIADLNRARVAKNRKEFEAALRSLMRMENDSTAQAALRDLVANPAFDFPDGGMAAWFGSSEDLLGSRVTGWAAAARARYERDSRSPGFTWDAGGWLYLVAAHGDAADLEWIARQYEAAPERPGEAIAALGAARPALAREALLRQARQRPLREGLWDAIANLAARSPADAFIVLHVIVAAESPVPEYEKAEVLRMWARTAPAESLGEVRARIHAMAAAGRHVRELITPVQVLADRGEDLAEFADIIASAGRELRRLVDEKRTADGTGPFYAIEYHRVAQTEENLAALEYAVQVLGAEETRGCQAILAKARSRSEWK